MGHAFQSPLRRWDVLQGIAESINAKTFVEVGCKNGKTTGHMLAACPDLHVIAIDPWSPVPNEAEDYKDWDYAAIEREFWENVGEHKDRCEMLRITSTEAAQCFADTASTPPDLVFIDAAHDYANVMADVRAWWPIVRKGGVLCGHDYSHKFPGVMRAVADCFPLMKVAVCPDSVWMVHKESGVLREAA